MFKALIDKDTYICPPIFLSSQSTDQLLCSFYLYFGQFNVFLQVLWQNSKQIKSSQNCLSFRKQEMFYLNVTKEILNVYQHTVLPLSPPLWS